MSERSTTPGIAVNVDALNGDVQKAAQMAPQWPLTKIPALTLAAELLSEDPATLYRNVAETLPVHWTRGLSILSMLMDSALITPSKVPWLGAREQNAFQPEDVALVKESMAGILQARGTFNYHKKDKKRIILDHLAQKGVITLNA